MDWAHGGGRNIKRLVIEERNNLAITPDGNHIYTFLNFDITDEDCEIIAEIEVPDALIEKAFAFANLQKEFYAFKEDFDILLENEIEEM